MSWLDMFTKLHMIKLPCRELEKSEKTLWVVPMSISNFVTGLYLGHLHF